jgi:nucleotide-binding universal stress UspA family protein
MVFRIIRRYEMAKKILVCLDGSESAEKILPYAIELALGLGGKLILLKVCSSVPLVTAASGSSQYLMVAPIACDMSARSQQELANLYLAKKARELVEERIEVDIATIVGSFTDSILRFIEENAIDLVAMTTYAYKGWKRLLYGSVVEDILRESRVPLLIINPAAVQRV